MAKDSWVFMKYMKVKSVSSQLSDQASLSQVTSQGNHLYTGLREATSAMVAARIWTHILSSEHESDKLNHLAMAHMYCWKVFSA